jgi:AcrR family transcriptional regulator
MRALTRPDSGPKRKLLDAAESLFAEKGFEVVSVRHITSLAKANAAALNYHFGSRAELLASVMLRYLAPITDERLARLDAIEQQASSGTSRVEEILEALVNPLSREVTKSELKDRSFYQLIGRILNEQGNDLPPPLEARFRQVTERFTLALSRALPTVPAEELNWRFHFLTGGLIHLLTHPDVPAPAAAAFRRVPTMAQTLEHFIRHAAAGLRQGIPLELEPLEEVTLPEDEPQTMFAF